MAFTENFSNFINPATPGYVLAAILGNDVGAIFDKNYQQSFEMNGSNTVIFLASSDLGAAEQGTAVVIDSVNYTIANIEPDGSGISTVQLQKAS
jgi:hypothetical protein